MASILLLMTTALASGCSGSAAAGSGPVLTDRVDMPPSYRFAPEVIQVVQGTAVTWTNSDNFTHSVQVGNGEVKVVKPGESIAMTFAEPGEYPYICTFHAQNMKGKVIVTPR